MKKNDGREVNGCIDWKCGWILDGIFMGTWSCFAWNFQKVELNSAKIVIYV